MNEPLKPSDMRYMDVGLYSKCDCFTCYRARRLTDTIEILANALAGKQTDFEIVTEWIKWSTEQE